jgi:flavin reductase (DIM6/NTAB) family NADH-FMN oxidoreductase RutF
MHIQSADLQQMSRFYRANLINCLSGYKPAVLVGTANPEKQTNLALFSNIFHVGADPALLGYVQRPTGQNGDTFRNIEATGAYTFNLVPAPLMEQAHYTSARFDPHTSEFVACRIRSSWIDDFAAPFVADSPVKIGLTLADIIPYDRNGTRFVIGQVQHILIDDRIIEADGNLNLAEASVLCTVGLEQYGQPSSLRKLPYAKVDTLPVFP